MVEIQLIKANTPFPNAKMDEDWWDVARVDRWANLYWMSHVQWFILPNNIYDDIDKTERERHDL